VDGDVVAEWFLLHVVAIDRIGAGPAPTADIQIFTLTAFALVGFEIAQIFKYLGVLPDFPKRNMFYISYSTVKIGAGLYITKTVYQTYSLGSDTPLASPRGEG
jgi:hypothetical protein